MLLTHLRITDLQDVLCDVVDKAKPEITPNKAMIPNMKAATHLLDLLKAKVLICKAFISSQQQDSPYYSGPGGSLLTGCPFCLA